MRFEAEIRTSPRCRAEDIGECSSFDVSQASAKRPRAKAHSGWGLFLRPKGRCYSEKQKQKQRQEQEQEQKQKQIPYGNDKKKSFLWNGKRK